MRSLLALLALSAFCLFIAVNPAKADPPIATAEACSTLGATHMELGNTALVFCGLVTPSMATTCATGGGCVWKVMSNDNSSGSGGGTYTAWGTPTCASGWTVVYTGTALNAWGTMNNYPMVTPMMCVNQGRNAVQQGTYPSYPSSNWYWSDGGTLASPTGTVSCAVCVK